MTSTAWRARPGFRSAQAWRGQDPIEVQAGHSERIHSPEPGSVVQKDADGYHTYMCQENGSYYLDLWVKTLVTGSMGHKSKTPGVLGQGR